MLVQDKKIIDTTLEETNEKLENLEKREMKWFLFSKLKRLIASAFFYFFSIYLMLIPVSFLSNMLFSSSNYFYENFEKETIKSLEKKTEKDIKIENFKKSSLSFFECLEEKEWAEKKLSEKDFSETFLKIIEIDENDSKKKEIKKFFSKFFSEKIKEIEKKQKFQIYYGFDLKHDRKTQKWEEKNLLEKILSKPHILFIYPVNVVSEKTIAFFKINKENLIHSIANKILRISIVSTFLYKIIPFIKNSFSEKIIDNDEYEIIEEKEKEDEKNFFKTVIFEIFGLYINLCFSFKIENFLPWEIEVFEKIGKIEIIIFQILFVFLFSTLSVAIEKMYKKKKNFSIEKLWKEIFKDVKNDVENIATAIVIEFFLMFVGIIKDFKNPSMTKLSGVNIFIMSLISRKFITNKKLVQKI